MRKGHVSRGYLGLGMQPVRLPEPLRAQLGLGDGALIVVMVEPSGPAARAGVLLGDVRVGLDRGPVGDLDDVQARLGSDRVGAEIPAVVLRGGVRTERRIAVGKQISRARDR